MRKLPYLAALLLMFLLIVPPSAMAQDNLASSARGNASVQVVFSGNGRTVTDSFNLESGLAIVTVCVGSVSATTGEATDIGPEVVNAGAGEVVARAGGAEARVSEDGAVARAESVVARAGGAVARSGDESTASRQVTFSGQTNNQVDTDCVFRTQGETNLGTSNLVGVNLLNEDGVQVGGNLNQTDSPAASSQAVRTNGGRHVLDVRAKGPWKIKIEHPHPSSAPQTTRFSGNQEAATSFFKLSEGSKTFKMAHRGNGRFRVQLLDKNGTKVGRSLVNAKGSFKGSKSVRVPRGDIYLLQVEANGPWAIRVQ
jgi:hypothetical protein